MKNILITGGSGFVGGYLKQQLPNASFVIRETDTVTDFLNYYLITGIASDTDWQGAFSGIQSIIHLAGIAHSQSFSERQFQEVNVDGAIHLAREAAAAGVKRFVFVSSIGVNGTHTKNQPFNPSDEPKPHNDYAKSKYDAEVGLKQLAKETGLEVVIVRPTLVYGPNAPGNFGMLTKLVNKLPVLPFGLAKNCRDFIAVQNLADLLFTCAAHPDAAGHTFLASDGETVSTKAFTNAIAEGLGKSVFQLPIPVSLMRLAGKLTGKSAMIEQLYGNLEVDSSNIKAVLGWMPPLTMKQAMDTLQNSGKE